MALHKTAQNGAQSSKKEIYNLHPFNFTQTNENYPFFYPAKLDVKVSKDFDVPKEDRVPRASGKLINARLLEKKIPASNGNPAFNVKEILLDLMDVLDDKTEIYRIKFNVSDNMRPHDVSLINSVLGILRMKNKANTIAISMYKNTKKFREGSNGNKYYNISLYISEDTRNEGGEFWRDETNNIEPYFNYKMLLTPDHKDYTQIPEEDLALLRSTDGNSDADSLVWQQKNGRTKKMETVYTNVYDFLKAKIAQFNEELKVDIEESGDENHIDNFNFWHSQENFGGTKLKATKKASGSGSVQKTDKPTQATSASTSATKPKLNAKPQQESTSDDLPF